VKDKNQLRNIPAKPFFCEKTKPFDRRSTLKYKPFTIDEATAGGMELTAHEETVAFMLEFLWTEDESVLSP
jgi:hypothetical protein